MGGQQLNHKGEPYLNGPNATKLNVVDTWYRDPALSSRSDSGLWLIYIHGGAWRDPEVDSKSFEPAINALWGSPSCDSIAGFASINYRLSPYPNHPWHPSSPEDSSRNVQHPAHVQDVAEALLYLDERYNIDNRYLLVGHSAGATMAFQFSNSYVPGRSLPQPTGVLGISGIYNFEAFVKDHISIPAYGEMMENAFPDRGIWADASPSSTLRSVKSMLWGNAKSIIISHSKEDGLVEDAQADYMLERARGIPQLKQKVHFLEATGPHDEIWGSGHILANLIKKSMQILGESAA